MAILNTNEYAGTQLLVEVRQDPETGERTQRTRLNQAARAGAHQQPQNNPYLGAAAPLSDADYALMQSRVGPESQMQTVDGGTVFSVKADVRETRGVSPQGGSMATGHEMWALDSETKGLSAGAPIGPHSMQVEQVLDQQGQSGNELSLHELRNASHLGSNKGQEAWEDGFETRQAAAPQVPAVSTQPVLGQDAPTAIAVQGIQDELEDEGEILDAEIIDEPVAPAGPLVHSSASKPIVSSREGFSSQAGLASVAAGAGTKSFASVPAPGEPGSRFNPRVVSREEQAARRETAAPKDVGRGTKSLGGPKKANPGTPGKKGEKPAEKKPAPSMMEQMMAEMKKGDGKGVGASFAKGFSQGLGQRLGQSGKDEVEDDLDAEAVEPVVLAQAEVNQVYGTGPSSHAGPGSPVHDFTGPSIAPAALAAQPLITGVPAALTASAAVVNHLGQSRSELAPAPAQGAISSKVVMNPEHVAALETMDAQEGAQQESSGGGYDR